MIALGVPRTAVHRSFPVVQCLKSVSRRAGIAGLTGAALVSIVTVLSLGKLLATA